MAKPTALYELNAIVHDDLTPVAAELAENLGVDQTSAEGAIAASAPRYADGEISQGAHWDDVAFRLGMLDTDLLDAFAQRGAEIDRALLAKARTQAATMTVGLVSDATPDWVGFFRKEYQLDQLFAVHIIDSEIEGDRSYEDLLKLAASRLAASPAQITFYGKKPRQRETAAALGMRLGEFT